VDSDWCPTDELILTSWDVWLLVVGILAVEALAVRPMKVGVLDSVTEVRLSERLDEAVDDDSA
jgi:hypothetical protein